MVEIINRHIVKYLFITVLLNLNMKKWLLASLVILMGLCTVAQPDYQSAANHFRDFYNKHMPDSIFKMFSPKVQQMLPVEKTRLMVQQLHTQFGELNGIDPISKEEHLASYKASFTKATFTMNLVMDSLGKLDGLRFVPYQEAGAGLPKEKSNFNLTTTDATIYGTLTKPENNSKIPVILIIAGSGPTDRNGNSPLGVNANVYKMLADSLMHHGFACLRYDKRGIGESINAQKRAILFEDMIRDAEGFIRLLKADQHFSKVIVLGHSEGSLIGMVAAEQAKADAYISFAGAGERIDKIMVRQFSEQSKELGVKAAILLDSLRKGFDINSGDSILQNIFTPAVQPYMTSWLKYNPQEEIKKLTIPLLIVQGTTDIQVRVEDAKELKAVKPSATLRIIENMNHIGKKAPADRQQNIATYAMPDLPLIPELVSSVDTFVNAVNKR